MAGNKTIYTDAMRKGYNLVWGGHFAEATREYQRALAEFPDDVAANSSLGAAYLRLQKFSEALAAFQAVRKKAPQDIVSLAKTAEIQARLGQREEAGKNFLALAQVYAQVGLPEKALEAHHQLVALLPDYLPGHLRLAEAYAAAGKSTEAGREYLLAARLYQKQSQFQEVITCLERALQQDSRNEEAARLLQTLRGGLPSTGPQAAAPTPSELAGQEAQARLAQDVFADRSGAEATPATAAELRVETLLGQALEYQARGQVNEAIASYQQVLQAGVKRAEVEYNLGLLYQQAGRYPEAIAQLTRTARLPDYAMGSHFALGQCYRNQGDRDKAMEHFLRAVDAIDLETVQREQADDLIALYKSLAEGYEMKGQLDKALTLVTSLANTLNTKGWNDKATSVQAQIASLSAAAGQVTPGPAVEMPEWQAVSQKIAAAETYLQQQLYLAAIEECHDVIGLAPGYLPIHYRLAVIYTRQGRSEHAVDKYLALANLHLVRQEPDQAIEAYRLATQAAPQALAPHARLAQLYLKIGQREQALAELDTLGDLQLEHGNKEEAAATLRQVIALGPTDVEGYRRLLAQLENKR